MKKASNFLVFAALLVLSATALREGRADTGPLPPQHPRLAQQFGYSASGTHQCRTSEGVSHSCVVTGLVFSNCIDAASSLRAQDCCPSTRACARDSQGRETECRRGGTSAGFTLNYCISGGGR